MLHSKARATLRALEQYRARDSDGMSEAKNCIDGYLKHKGAQAEEKWHALLRRASVRAPGFEAYVRMARSFNDAPLTLAGVAREERYVGCKPPSLPRELRDEVLRHCDLTTIFNLRRISRAWREAVEDPRAMWKHDKSDVLSQKLRMAARRSCLPAINFWLSHGANPGSTVDGENYLDWIMVDGQRRPPRHLVEIFVDAGAPVNGVTIKDGSTPLMYAVQAGEAEHTQFLLARGADVHACDRNYGKGMLDWALVNRKRRGIAWEVVHRLLDAGLGINDVTVEDGSTPLMYAAQRGDFGAVNALMARGANPLAVNTREGKTVVEYALCDHINGPHRQVARRLQEDMRIESDNRHGP